MINQPLHTTQALHLNLKIEFSTRILLLLARLSARSSQRHRVSQPGAAESPRGAFCKLRKATSLLFHLILPLTVSKFSPVAKAAHTPSRRHTCQ